MTNNTFYTPEQREAHKQLILEMYAQRAPISTISAALGLSRGTTIEWLEEAIREIKDPNPSEERKKDLILIDSSIRALIPKVKAGNVPAHMALNRWLERRAKCLGLDQPDKLDLGVGFTGSIEEEVSALLEKLGIVLDNPVD